MSISSDKTLGQFGDELASKAPVPGGGGASALVGSLACALGQMVCNLTVGKPRYASVEKEVASLLAALDEKRGQLMAAIDEDAVAFEPLSKAYGIPKDDPSRLEVMEKALLAAIEPPLGIMELCAQVIDMLERLAQIGSKLALSDVGVGAACARAALLGASLNVYINAASLADRERAQGYEAKVDEMCRVYGEKAQAVFEKVREDVR